MINLDKKMPIKSINQKVWIILDYNFLRKKLISLKMEELYFNFLNRIFKPYQPKIVKLYHKLGNFKNLYDYLRKNRQF